MPKTAPDYTYVENGQRIEVRWSTTHTAAAICDLCKAGTCIQKVLSCKAWTDDMVVHCEPQDLD